MNCENVKDCSCPKKSCPNHGRCCDCVIKHKNTDSMPFCLFPNNDGDKSNKNLYRKLKEKFEGVEKMLKPKVDNKRCFASKEVCTAIKCCPVGAIYYIEVDEPLLDKTLNCNCGAPDRTGKIPVTCSDGSCGESGCGDDLYSCGGTPYGRIIIDYEKCIACGLCAKECCGTAIDMV